MKRTVLILMLTAVMLSAVIPLLGRRNVSIEISYALEAQGRIKDAVQIMLQLERNHPQEPFFKLRLGWLFFSMEDYKKAEQYYGQSLQLDKSLEAWEGLMNSQYYQADWEKTIGTGKEILAKYPHNFIVLTAVAYSFYAMADYSQAALYYGKAAGIYPYNLEVMGYLLSSYHLSGETGKAKEIYQKLAQYNPENYFIQAYKDIYSR